VLTGCGRQAAPCKGRPFMSVMAALVRLTEKGCHKLVVVMRVDREFQEHLRLRLRLER
jgi:hypothetical protein